MAPSTLKEEAKGKPFGPVLAWRHPSRSNSSISANSLLPTQVGLHDVLNTRLGTSICPEPEVAPRAVPVVALKYARRELPDEDVRRAALDKLRSLLVLDAEATHLGRSLQQIANRTSSPDLIEQSVSDCFRSKASSTLQKRASSLWRFSKLVRECGAESPLRFTEEVLYNCLCLLRERGSGATSAQHILESLWFLDGTAKFAVINLATTVSGRCRGVARDMYLKKDPLQQKQPLTAKQVMVLELLMKSLPARDQCILGQILFCIHACCRWRDSQRVQRISLEEGSGEVLVYCEALSSKTSLTAESQTRFLPYVALGHGLNAEDWATTWVEARASEGLGFTDYALPYMLEAGVNREELRNFGSHSCKTTLLTWAGRSSIVRFSNSDRRQLGHHMKPGTKSILTYSREACTTLYGRVLAMFKTIRNGSFDPDLSSVSRVVKTAQDVNQELTSFPVEDPTADVHVTDSESSLGSELDAPPETHPDLAQFEAHRVRDFAAIAASSLVAHRVSGVVHVANEDGFLLCGRRPSANFSSYLDCEGDHPNLESCVQCLRALKRSAD